MPSNRVCTPWKSAKTEQGNRNSELKRYESSLLSLPDLPLIK